MKMSPKISFLIIPLTTLFDEFIDRRSLAEPKKTVEHVARLPLNWVGTINFSISKFKISIIALNFFLWNQCSIASHYGFQHND